MSLLQSTVHNSRSLIPAQPATIRRFIKQMRGGSQSWLVQCDNDRHYVAKFLGNPQGRRTLMNELIAYQLIRQLDVVTPPLALLHLPEDLAQHDELYFLMGDKRVRPEGRLHLGSQVPMDPATTAIFDFLPDRLLSKVSNLSDFATMFVLDKWLHQTDSRQAVFIRNTHSRATSYLAHFIDHGKCFDGSSWELRDAPLHGLAVQKKVYSEINMRSLVEIALSKVENISEEDLLATAPAIPTVWFEQGDRECLEMLLSHLRQRQLTLPLLITRHLNHLGF